MNRSKPENDILYHVEFDVSILVLLDESLEDPLIGAVPNGTDRFNPCSLG